MTNQSASEVTLLREILSNLVTEPNDIAISEKNDDLGTLLEVTVNQKDMGAVIGKAGIMANSIKIIMRAVGRAREKNLKVKFLEPTGSQRQENYQTDNTPSNGLDEFVIN